MFEMRNKFSVSEWVDLQVLALWVLMRVASADGSATTKEWKEILAILKNFGTAESLIGQVTRSITYAQIPKLNEYSAKFRNRVPAVRAMALERLGAVEYGALVAGLMAMAVEVARFEGRTDSGLAAHISLEEQDILLKLAAELS